MNILSTAWVLSKAKIGLSLYVTIDCIQQRIRNVGRSYLFYVQQAGQFHMLACTIILPEDFKVERKLMSRE